MSLSINKTYVQSKYNVTKTKNRRTNKLVKYLVIHNTGTNASAKNNCIYFGSKTVGSSADYFIDKDGAIYKFNKDCALYFTWHCGCKSPYKSLGATNANSIGIECVGSGKFTTAQIKSLSALVKSIQKTYSIPDSRVIRHYDCNTKRKQCPTYYSGSTTKTKRWSTLKKTLLK